MHQIQFHLFQLRNFLVKKVRSLTLFLFLDRAIPNIEQQITATQVVDAVPALNGVLHRRGQFAIGPSELF